MQAEGWAPDTSAGRPCVGWCITVSKGGQSIRPCATGISDKDYTHCCCYRIRRLHVLSGTPLASSSAPHLSPGLSATSDPGNVVGGRTGSPDGVPRRWHNSTRTAASPSSPSVLGRPPSTPDPSLHDAATWRHNGTLWPPSHLHHTVATSRTHARQRRPESRTQARHARRK